MAAVPSPVGGPSYAGGPARAPQAAATEGLYERHAAKILGYCLHQLGSREEAEDAVQTTFMNAFRALGRGVVPEAESAWLFKIAENVCLSRRRSSWRRGRIESPSDFDVIEEVVPGPSRQRDELIGIEDALASMPEQQRRAILLREWQGLSYREISDELELSQSAVETLIFRARRSLAQGLEQPDLLKRPKRKSFRRALHAIDLGTVAAAAKTVLAGSAAVKATAVAVTVTAAATAGTVTPKLEGHSPKSATAPALVRGRCRDARHCDDGGHAVGRRRVPRGARGATGRDDAHERRRSCTGGSASGSHLRHRRSPNRSGRCRTGCADGGSDAPQAEPAAMPAAAEPAAQPPVVEQPTAAPAPAAQPSHVEPAPIEPAIVDQATPKQRSPYAVPVIPAPEPISQIIAVALNDVKSSIVVPALEPVVVKVGIVTTPVPAPTAQPAGSSFGGK